MYFLPHLVWMSDSFPTEWLGGLHPFGGKMLLFFLHMLTLGMVLSDYSSHGLVPRTSPISSFVFDW
jgi:hypothetical protein